MSDEDVTSVPIPEPFEWYKAIAHGEVIGEGPTPMPDDIREKATEIQWSNPTTDPSFTPDTLPDEPVQVERTAPAKPSDVPNMPRFEPEVPQPNPNESEE